MEELREEGAGVQFAKGLITTKDKNEETTSLLYQTEPNWRTKIRLQYPKYHNCIEREIVFGIVGLWFAVFVVTSDTLIPT